MLEDKEFAYNRKKGNVREETSRFRHDGHERANQHQKPLPSLSHQHPEMERRREQGVSEAEVRKSKRQPYRHLEMYMLRITLRLLASSSNVSFVSQNLDVNFPHWKDEDQPNKRPKMGDEKSAHRDPPESMSISRNGTKV